MRLFILLLPALVLPSIAMAQAPPGSRDLELRDRYEQVLAHSPFQGQAFDRAYQLYAIHEGIAAWDAALERAQAAADSPVPALVVRARIAARRFDVERAVHLLEEARAAGAEGAEFALLLGRTYHDAGRDEEAVPLLEEALDSPLSHEDRGRVSRLLGNLLLRSGQREAAVEAWKRIAEGAQADAFVLEELAVLYEGQRMWPEAIETWSRLAAEAEGDPYLRCRALRAVGDAERARGRHREAAAAYQEALEWVAPGNWLFDALTQSLLDTHAAMDDLPGLARSLEEMLRTSPAQTEYRVLLGDVHRQLRQWDEAEESYREAIARAPSQQAGYAALIRLHEARGNDEGLIEAYRAAIQRFPGERDYHRRLGEAYLRTGEREEALVAWRGTLGPRPSAADHANLAQWLEARGFRDEARQAYEDAVGLDSRRPWVMRLAALEFEGGHRDRARARWLELAGAEAGADELLDVAGALEARGFQDEAEDLLRRAVEAAPDRMDIVLAHADLLLMLARHEEAEHAYTRLQEEGASDFHRMRGERGMLDVLQAQGRLASVRSEWEQQVRTDRTDVALRLRLAQLCERMGDRGRALALYRESAEIEPENPELLHRLARVYESVGSADEAIAVYRQLIALEPGRAGGYYRELVPLLAQQGNEAEAIEAARRVVESAPMDPEAQTLLARVYERFEQTGPRLEAHREAVRLSPAEPGYHEAFGRALLEAGAVVEARDAFRAMFDAARDSSVRLRAVQHMAEVYARIDRMDELVREFEALVHESPRDLENYELLATVHRAAGMPADALAVLERAASVSDDRETALRRVLVEAHAAGYLETVVRTYEELERMATAMEPREWEQLGRAYAQLGRMAEAVRAWEHMPREHPHDATVMRAYIRVVREYGLEDAALAATERLLGIERHDYATRLEYAQELAAADRVDDAMEQLRTLLRLGAGPAEEAAAEQSRAEGQPQRFTPYSSMAGAQFGAAVNMQGMLGTGLAPGGPAFNAARREALHLLAQFAMRQGEGEAILAEYEALVSQDPDMLAPYHDLLLVLAALDRQEPLLALAREMADRFGVDPEVLQLAARLHELHGEFDDAMEIYSSLHDLENAIDTVRMGTRIRLLAAAGRKDEVQAAVNALREAFPNQVSVLRQAAGQLASMDDLEQAEELYRAVGDADERHRQNALQELAHHYRNRGLSDDAVRIYGELLTLVLHPDRTQHPPPEGFPTPYLPQIRAGMTQSVDAVIRLLAHRFDWPRLEAFQQITALSTEPGTITAMRSRMEEIVKRDTPREPEGRQRAYELALLLASHAIEQGDADAALSWLPHLERLDATLETLANLRLLAHEQAHEYDAMREVYGELAESHPQEAGTFRLAQARIAMLEGNWQTAEEALVVVVHEPGRQRDIVGMIRQLHDAGEHARANRLIDAYLTDPNPLPDAYGLRIQLRSALGHHEEAMAFARESWEYTATQQIGGRAARLGQIRSPRDLEGSPMVNLLQATYREAGQERELIPYLEQWHERSPNNPQIQLDLAHAYRSSGRQQQALDIYRGLVERRPGDRALRLSFASILAMEFQDDEAYAMFDEALRSNPALFREHHWHVRQVYDRLGKSRELAMIEERLALASPDARVMQQMAQEAENTGNMALAALVYDRLVRMAPGDYHHRHRLAESQRRAGMLDEALDTWRSFLRALEAQPGQTVVEVSKAAPLFAYAGARTELETLAAGRLADDPADALGLVLSGGLAQHDGDYRQAFAYFERLLDARPEDHAVFATALDLARIEGNHDGAIALIDRYPGPAQARWGDLAELYAAKGDSARAYEYLQRDATRHSGQHGVDQALRRMVDHGLYAEARAYFDQHIARMRTSPSLHDNFVQQALRAYLRGGEAPEAWVRSVLGELRNEPGWILGGLIQGNEGTLERQRQLMRWALEERPNDENLVRLAVQHAQQRWHDDFSLWFMEEIIALHPNHTEAEAGYVSMLVQRGNARRALAFIEKALEDEPTAARLEHAFRICEFAGEHTRLLALRDRYAPLLDEKDRQRLTTQWAQAIAVAGEPEPGVDALRAEWENAGNQEAIDRYLDMLFRVTGDRTAFELFEEVRREGFYAREGHLHAPAIHIMAATGRLEELADIVWEQAANSQAHQAAGTLQRVVGALRTAGSAEPFMREWMRRLEPDDDFALGVAMRSIDSAQRMQMNAWHDDLLAAALLLRPDHWELLQRNGQSLIAAGRHDEAAASLEEALFNTPASRRQALQFAVVEAHATAGDTGKVDRLLQQNLHPLPLHAHELGPNTQLLTRAGRHDEAAESAALWARSPQQRERAMAERAAALARAGKVDDALAVYTDEPGLPQAQNACTAMIAQGRLDAALQLLDISVELGNNPHSVYPSLLNAMLASMTLEECVEAVPALRQTLRMGNGAGNVFIHETVHALLRHRGEDEVIILLDALDEPLLWAEGARNLALLAVEQGAPAGDDWLVTLGSAIASRPTAVLSAADSLLQFRATGMAKTLLDTMEDASALDEDDSLALARLAMRAGSLTGPVLFAQAFAQDPALLLEAPDGAALIAMSGEEALLADWRPLAAGTAAFPQQVMLMDAAVALGRGDAGEAAAVLADIEPLSRLRGKALEGFALWMALHGHEDMLIALARRVADSSVQRETRYRVLETAFQAAAGIGDADNAAVLLDALLWLGTPEPWAVIERAAASWPVDGREAAADAIADKRGEWIQGPAALGLAYLESLLAGSRDGDIESVAEAWQLAPWQRDLLRLAEYSPRLWRVSPRMPADMPGAMEEPLPDFVQAALSPDTPLDSIEGWPLRTRLVEDPAALPGTFTPHLTPRIERHGVYLATDLHSPDERTVQFASSADDWHRVWLNGEEIFVDDRGGPVIALEDRYDAPLRAGRNRVVVWLGNGHGSAALSLGIVENGAGLHFGPDAGVEGQLATR